MRANLDQQLKFSQDITPTTLARHHPLVHSQEDNHHGRVDGPWEEVMDTAFERKEKYTDLAVAGLKATIFLVKIDCQVVHAMIQAEEGTQGPGRGGRTRKLLA